MCYDLKQEENIMLKIKKDADLTKYGFTNGKHWALEAKWILVNLDDLAVNLFVDKDDVLHFEAVVDRTAPDYQDAEWELEGERYEESRFDFEGYKAECDRRMCDSVDSVDVASVLTKMLLDGIIEVIPDGKEEEAND